MMTNTDLAVTTEPSHPLLQITGLTVEYKRPGRRSPIRAVDGVDLGIAPGETLGLVGESGSGKSTLGRAILGLTPAAEGVVNFAGNDITHLRVRQRRTLSSKLQVIFQDPYSSMNPARTIGQTLGEMLIRDRSLRADDVAARVTDMLQRVGLSGDAARRYPAHFSGGQRQRIAIARALMVRPSLVICDEAVSALDLSVQAQILNLLGDLQEEFGLAYLFIAHDLAVVRHVSHRIAVMYRGRIVEHGDAEAVCSSPRHPYTQTLLDAAPIPDPELQRNRRLARTSSLAPANDTPSAEACHFVRRCIHAGEGCSTRRPDLEATTHGTLVACHRIDELPSRNRDPAQAPPTDRKGHAP